VSYLVALSRVWLTEWRHTLRSAMREHSLSYAVNLWLRELRKGVVGLPSHAREIRSAHR
jgi:hypothetical protein